MTCRGRCIARQGSNTGTGVAHAEHRTSQARGALPTRGVKCVTRSLAGRGRYGMMRPSRAWNAVACCTQKGEPVLSITATDEWRAAFPGGGIGLLEVILTAPAAASPALNKRKRGVEAELRQRYGGFTRADFLALPIMAAYNRYYKRFDKTYHVLLQVESIALKGKSLPDVSPLVDANFCAEVETLVLTAGHDVSQVQPPVVIDVSRPGDEMTQMNGAARALRAGDMIMRDTAGVACSIIYGQDDRSPITDATTHVLYVAYAPAGVPAEAVDAQLQDIAANIRLFAPGATVEQLCQIRA